MLDGARPPATPAERRLLALADAARGLPRHQLDPARRAARRAHLIANLAEPASAAAQSGQFLGAGNGPVASGGSATGGEQVADHASSAHPAWHPGARGRRVRRGAVRGGRMPRVARSLTAAGVSAAVALVVLTVGARDALPGQPL